MLPKRTEPVTYGSRGTPGFHSDVTPNGQVELTRNRSADPCSLTIKIKTAEGGHLTSAASCGKSQSMFSSSFMGLTVVGDGGSTKPDTRESFPESIGLSQIHSTKNCLSVQTVKGIESRGSGTPERVPQRGQIVLRIPSGQIIPSCPSWETLTIQRIVVTDCLIPLWSATIDLASLRSTVDIFWYT